MARRRVGRRRRATPAQLRALAKARAARRRMARARRAAREAATPARARRRGALEPIIPAVV